MTAFDIGIHIIAAFSAVIIGIIVLSMPKGTHRHKQFGRIWVVLMTIVAIGSFRLHGLNHEGSFSLIHALSAFTLLSMAYAIYSIRRQNRRVHIGAMIGSFSGLVVAGIFTLVPGRIIGSFFFGS